MRCTVNERSGTLELARSDELGIWISTAAWCLVPLIAGLTIYCLIGTGESLVISTIGVGGLIWFRLSLELPSTLSRIDFDETSVILRLYFSPRVIQLTYLQIPAIKSFDYAMSTRYSIDEEGAGRQWVFIAATADENLAFARMIELWKKCRSSSSTHVIAD